MSASEKSKASTPAADKGNRSPDEIRADIDETREELGETVAAVADKADVKKQARAKTEEVKEQAGATAQQAKAKAQELGERAKGAAPDSASEGAQQAQRLAQENPVALAIGGAFLAGFILGKLLSR